MDLAGLKQVRHVAAMVVKSDAGRDLLPAVTAVIQGQAYIGGSRFC